jgi:lysophospholipase L1-like esterase
VSTSGTKLDHDTVAAAVTTELAGRSLLELDAGGKIPEANVPDRLSDASLRGLPSYASTRTKHFNPDLSTYNAKPAQMRAWRAALAQVKAGIGDAIIGTIGDSTVSGYKATPGLTAFPDWIRRELAAEGYPTKGEFVAINTSTTGAWDNGFGDAASGRITAASPGWARVFDWSNIVQGGQSAGALSVAHTVPGTIARVYFGANPNSVFTIKIDGTATATITCDAAGVPTITSGTGTITRNPITVVYTATGLSNTAHTITITPSNAYATQLFGTEVTGTGYGVRLFNLGIGGSTAAYLTANQYAQASILHDLTRPDLLIVCSEINGCGSGGSVPAFTTQTTAALATFDDFWDCSRVLVSANPVQGLDADASYPAYTDALYGVAEAKDVRLIDHLARWNWADYTSLGLMGDNAHPNAAGYLEKARLILDAIDL